MEEKCDFVFRISFTDASKEHVDETLSEARLLVEEAGGTWEDYQEEPSDGNASSILLDSVLGKLYDSHGKTEDVIMKTSAELSYEIEDMCEAQPKEVADWLSGHGFETIVLNGTVNWVLYEKNVSY